MKRFLLAFAFLIAGSVMYLGAQGTGEQFFGGQAYFLNDVDFGKSGTTSNVVRIFSSLWKIPTAAVTALQIGQTSTTVIANFDTTNQRLGVNNVAPTVALDVTGAIAGSTTITAGTNIVATAGYFQAYSRTKAQFDALTPSVVGQIYYCSDCAVKNICVSSGTAPAQFVRADLSTAGCGTGN